MEETNQVQQTKPNSHMVMAIISTVLSVITCTGLGLIPGIVSIVFASQVNSKFNSGNYEAAQKSSKNAKIAWIISVVITVAILIYTFAVVGSSWGEIMETFQQEMERQQSLQE
jgi:uncharacterized membrane protein YedE/YeeE